MAEPFLGEIKLLGFSWVPENWALCNGAQLPIAQNQALYRLIGSAFGESNPSSFSLPDFRGRVPIGPGNGKITGDQGGVENVSLTLAEMPWHSHPYLVADQAGNAFVNSGGCLIAQSAQYDGSGGMPAFRGFSPNTTLSDLSCSGTGGNQSHNNLQPTAVANYCIALTGTYPRQN